MEKPTSLVTSSSDKMRSPVVKRAKPEIILEQVSEEPEPVSRLVQMARKAVEDHLAGKTEPFPM